MHLQLRACEWLHLHPGHIQLNKGPINWLLSSPPRSACLPCLPACPACLQQALNGSGSAFMGRLGQRLSRLVLGQSGACTPALDLSIHRVHFSFDLTLLKVPMRTGPGMMQQQPAGGAAVAAAGQLPPLQPGASTNVTNMVSMVAIKLSGWSVARGPKPAILTCHHAGAAWEHAYD